MIFILKRTDVLLGFFFRENHSSHWAFIDINLDRVKHNEENQGKQKLFFDLF